MPFYQGTKRVLLSSGARPVFLPRLGTPFFDAPIKLASSVTNRTVSSEEFITSTRRSNPLEYNSLTVTASGMLTVDPGFGDGCLFIRCNILVLDGGIRVQGGQGNDASGSFAGAGGSGSGGGGGGAGAEFCSFRQGGEGGEGVNGTDGESGAEGEGGPGGSGYGLANWGNDGYASYAQDLGGMFEFFSTPYLWGGDAESTDISCCSAWTTGGGGGCGGIIVIACNQLSGTADQFVSVSGGNPGVANDPGLSYSHGGDGGGILFYVKTGGYPAASLASQMEFNGGSGSEYDGNANIFSFTTGGVKTLRSFSTPF